VYPDWLAWIVRFSPLYNAISLVRSFTLGHVTWYCVLNVLYLATLGVFGILLARRRMAGLLLT
jgi:lipooligosaccharide transport system permease protein